eukprot:364408-Chlamydomonas_euryale.AAC.4
MLLLSRCFYEPVTALRSPAGTPVLGAAAWHNRAGGPCSLDRSLRPGATAERPRPWLCPPNPGAVMPGEQGRCQRRHAALRCEARRTCRRGRTVGTLCCRRHRRHGHAAAVCVGGRSGAPLPASNRELRQSFGLAALDGRTPSQDRCAARPKARRRRTGVVARASRRLTRHVLIGQGGEQRRPVGIARPTAHLVTTPSPGRRYLSPPWPYRRLHAVPPRRSDRRRNRGSGARWTHVVKESARSRARLRLRHGCVGGNADWRPAGSRSRRQIGAGSLAAPAIKPAVSAHGGAAPAARRTGAAGPVGTTRGAGRCALAATAFSGARVTWKAPCVAAEEPRKKASHRKRRRAVLAHPCPSCVRACVRVARASDSWEVRARRSGSEKASAAAVGRRRPRALLPAAASRPARLRQLPHGNNRS